MGNWTRNSPSARGAETRGARSLQPPYNGLIMDYLRVRVPSAGTISHLHVCLPTIVGAPGLWLAVIDTLQPPNTVSTFLPGSDTGAALTNIQNQAGGALSFAQVNEPQNDANYGRNSIALTFTNYMQALLAANNSGALAGRRIGRVVLKAMIMNRYTTATGTALTTNASAVVAQGVLRHFNAGGVDYLGPQKRIRRSDQWQTITLLDLTTDPTNGLPWTVANVDQFLTPATGGKFGVRVYGKGDLNMLRVKAWWLEVTHVLDNRHGFYAARGTPRTGWDKYALASTSAEAANTYYWVEIGPLAGDPLNYFTHGFVIPTTAPVDNDATNNSNEQRATWFGRPLGYGGPLPDGNVLFRSDNNAMGVVLLDQSGTILADSQPYPAVDFVARYFGATANVGQQVTTDTTQPAGGYRAVKLTGGWQNAKNRPLLPLKAEVRVGPGAITGGGQLVVTGQVQPDDTADGTVQDLVAVFPQAWVLANSTQYHIHVRSDSPNGWGWKVSRMDSRSDLIPAGSGTTAANIQGAGVNGTTDSFFTAGAADARYDLSLALVGPGALPPTVQVRFFPGEPSSLLTTLAPRTRITWPDSNLGTNFQETHVWRRQRRTPAAAPVMIGRITVPTGYTAATVAAQHREFWDYEAGWSIAGGQYETGYEWGVSHVNAASGWETAIRWATDQPQTPTPPRDTPWLCSNAAPWLNTPLYVEARPSSDVLQGPTVYPLIQGRDEAVVRVPGVTPGRKYALRWAQVPFPDEGILAGPRAAAWAGRQMALLDVLGDALYGTLVEPSTARDGARFDAEANFITTGRQPAVADANFPAGIMLNGSSQYASTPDDPLLQPGVGPFTLLIVGVFPATNGAVHLSKGDVTTTGFGIRNSSATAISATVNNVNLVTGVTPVDGLVHAVIASIDQSSQLLTIDGALADQKTNTYTNVNTTTALIAGANNGGASGFSAMGPLIAWCYWPRALSLDEHSATAKYCLGHSIVKMGYGANVFYDLRDDRCYGSTGFVHDLGPNLVAALDALLVAAPTQRGIPWQIRQRDRKR